MLQKLFLRPNSADAAQLSHLYPSISLLITSSHLLSPAPGACATSASAVAGLCSCLRHRHCHSPPLALALSLSPRSCAIRELLDRRRTGAKRPGQPASAILDLPVGLACGSVGDGSEARLLLLRRAAAIQLRLIEQVGGALESLRNQGVRE